MMHIEHLIDLVADLRIFIVVVVDEAEHICFPWRRIHLLICILLLYLDLVHIGRRLIIVGVVV